MTPVTMMDAWDAPKTLPCVQEARIPSAEALRALVVAILDSIFFESDLRERWAGRALTWALEAESPHLACRSHQVPVC